ncbi:hypothetical protein ACO2Q3_11595 [Caulobacter sp. KR2-114]|uniref:hypothetical protein n=1 Tax=Caulobacter sp. KR2-114 TaxID=3400912 RepID=UPI003C034AED
MGRTLFAFALAAAASLAPSLAGAAETDAADKGWIVMSVAGCANDDPLHMRFLVKRDHPYKSFRVSESPNNIILHHDFKGPRLNADSSAHQDNCGPKGISGQVLVFEAPSGIYEVDRITVDGFMNAGHVRNPIEPFEVKPGRTSYVGEVFVPGGVEIGLRFHERESLVVSDQSARDMPIAQKKNANVAALSHGDNLAAPGAVRVRQ